MKRIAVLVTSMTLMLIPSTAFAAGSSTCQSYNPQLCPVSGVTATRSPSSSTTSPGQSPASQVQSASAGTLPFTGLDVGLVAAGGAVLLAAGLVVRRISAQDR